MTRVISMTQRLSEERFRPKTTWKGRTVSILLFVFCLFAFPSTTSAGRPMKFHVEFESDIEHFTSKNAAGFLTRVVHLVLDEISRILKVSKEETALVIDSWRNDSLCEFVHVPEMLTGKSGYKNVDADFALFIRVEHCRTSEDSGAVSASCSFSQRPIAGVISFCSRIVEARSAAQLAAVALRHLVALLGFDRRVIFLRQLAAKTCLLKEAGTVRCWNPASPLRHSAPILISPKVAALARIFTGNRSTPGLPLSPEGRGWDSSVMFTSLLADSPITKEIAPSLALDAITLALLQDLSWYEVQWDTFDGDALVWGRAADALPKTCAAACALGFCNRSSEAPCFQLGPSETPCVVCQNLDRLKWLQDRPCFARNCDPKTKSYIGVCRSETGESSDKCPGNSKCPDFQFACVTKTLTLVTRIAAKIESDLTTTSTPPTSTIPTTSSPKGSRFSLRFPDLDFDSVAIFYFPQITAQIKARISSLLGVTDREIVHVVRITKGSTIVEFVVYNIDYTAKKIFLILQRNLFLNDLILTLNGSTYTASELKSKDYDVPRSYLTEMIVGSTLGLVLVIGVTSVIVIIVAKKIKRPANSVYPLPEAPSEVDSVFGRSNSLQTVSVASYAGIYEMRREWGSGGRPTSLRNVVVTSGGLHESGHL